MCRIPGLALLVLSSVDGFLRPVTVRVTRGGAGQSRTATSEGDDAPHPGRAHRWKHEPFDFSSKFGWDHFYEQGLQRTADVAATEEAVGVEDPSLEFEWHAHIPHSAIIDAIAPAIAQARAATKGVPSLLLVGCGNSALPRILHDAFDAPVRVTCLDYSPVCIAMVRSMYAASCPNMRFVVGDATQLQDVRWDGDDVVPTAATEKKDERFDVVIDKGLLDAIMCGEGCDVARLMGGLNDVLTPREWGRHVLISFPLSTATKRSLVDAGENGCGGAHLVWDFDVPVDGSEGGRGCFNVAARGGRAGARGVVVPQITTQWS